MNPRIYISALSFRAPSVQDLAGLTPLLGGAAPAVTAQVHELSPGRKVLVLPLLLDAASGFYPNRKDVKVMRDDVIAATKCGQEILARAGIPVEERAKLTLYMSNGICMDQLLENINDISRAYVSQEFEQDLASKHKRVEKATPPLFVLNALTNGAGSFVAQYTGVKGDNTVYGNTSHSTYDCLEEAVSALNSGLTEKVLVGAANGAGLFSALTFLNLADLGGQDWRMSNASGFVLLETERSLGRRGARPLAEVVSLSKSHGVPSLLKAAGSPYTRIRPSTSTVFYSGGLGEGDYAAETDAVQSKWEDCRSFYRAFGSSGVFAPLLNLYGALLGFSEGKLEQADCLNRDPYGRESQVQLRRVV